MLNISGLKQGIVIDHIAAGGAMKIYEYLNLEKLDCSVAIIKNAKSSKMGKKDIVKIEGPIQVDLDILGVLDPNLTLESYGRNVVILIDEYDKPLLAYLHESERKEVMRPRLQGFYSVIKGCDEYI